MLDGAFFRTIEIVRFINVFSFSNQSEQLIYLKDIFYSLVH